jgi:Nucleotidyl transferase AbiEii toxin, Type IV TA system
VVCKIVLLADAPLTFREFVTHEEVPLAAIFREVLEFLGGRADVIMFGAHAVNAYCEPERMTQDVDLLSTHASELAEQLRERLAERLRIATRVREVVPGQGFRIYQVRKPSNRHLVDVRQIDLLPASQQFAGVEVIAPPELIAMKVISMVHRAGRPKAGTDLVDVQRLLLTFPELKTEDGRVADRLRHMSASEDVLSRWRELAHAPITPDEDEGY